MTTLTQKPERGVADFLKSTFKVGIGATETIHQAFVEVPLNMLKGVGVSEEDTTALKDKHRGLLRNVYGSIDALTVSGLDGVSSLADTVRGAVTEVVEEGEKELKTVSKAVAKKAKE